MKIINAWKIPVLVILAVLSVSYTMLFIMNYYIPEKPDTIAASIFNKPVVTGIMYLSLIIVMYIIGRISVKDEAENMKRRCNRLIDSKYEKLVQFTQFTQTLVNNDASELVRKFLEQIKKNEDINGDEIK
jgi:ABC-type thiamin/hydroxymethylpyrimidine transport system permease subunit